jgi:hypothetical protein
MKVLSYKNNSGFRFSPYGGWVSAYIKSTKKDIFAYGCGISEKIVEITLRNNKNVNFSVDSICQSPFGEISLI